MAQAVIFHYRDSDSFLTRCNPNAKLVALISYSVIIASVPCAAVFPIALLPAAAAVAIKLPIKAYMKESIPFIVLALIMAAASVITYGNALEGTAKATAFLSTVLASMLLTDTTMPDEAASSLGAALYHIIGRRAFTMASIVEITLSMIPMITDSAVTIAEAMQSRGASLHRHPLRFLTQFSSSMLTDLLDRAEAYTDALYSRGYDASRRRRSAPYGKRDAAMIAISAASLLASVTLA